MATHITDQGGGAFLPYTNSASGDISVGEVIDAPESGGMFMVAATTMYGTSSANYIAGVTNKGSVQVGGLCTLTKLTTTGQTFAIGAKVYWNTSSNACTATASGNYFIGLAAKAAAQADTTVQILLNGTCGLSHQS
jgi:predicted RecA/RadA family phage recombinase